MSDLTNLLDNNRRWAAKINDAHPDFFARLSTQQAPKYLWIGCSDSRVPANQIVGLMPGEIFVHRNIANVVVHSDLNCLSVIQYAVEVLGVRHIVVVGHYDCGGVRAALENKEHGLIDNWLRHIKDVYRFHQDEVDALSDENEKCDLLCELNVIEQVANVCHTTIVQKAWMAGRDLTVHGWIYGLGNGMIKDLKVSVEALEQVGLTHRLR